jgi:hypothetical protein
MHEMSYLKLRFGNQGNSYSGILETSREAPFVFPLRIFKEVLTLFAETPVGFSTSLRIGI